MVGVTKWLKPEDFQNTVSAFQSGTSAIIYAPSIHGPAADTSTGSVIIDKIRAAAMAPGAGARMAEAKKKQAMFENDYKAELDELIAAAFCVEQQANMRLTQHLSTNVLLGIAAELAMLYQSPPTRYLKAPRAECPACDALATVGEKCPSCGAMMVDPADEADVAAKAAAAGKPPPEADDKVNSLDDITKPADDEDPELEALLVALDLTEAGGEDEAEPYEVMVKRANLDATLQTVEQLCAVHECVWLRPNLVEESAPEGSAEATTSTPEADGSPKLGFTLYTPANADVLLDPVNHSRVLAFWYWGTDVDKDGKSIECVHVYTAENYQKLGKDWRPLGPVAPNPLGRIPVVKFELGTPVNGYYCKGIGKDLHAGTLEIAFLKTIQNQRAKDTAFKQLAIQGDPDKVPARQVMGGSAPIMLGAGNSASVIDLQPYLEEWTKLCASRKKDLEDRYGIVVDAEATGQAQSGYALKLRHSKVLKESKRRRPFFAASEQALYALVAKLCAAVAGWAELDPEAELVVDFAEPTFDENPEQQVTVDALELELNAVSILDVLKRRNPDLSETQLARLAHRNRKINEALMPAKAERLIDFLSMGPGIEGGGAPGAGGPPGAPPPRGAPAKAPPKPGPMPVRPGMPAKMGGAK